VDGNATKRFFEQLDRRWHADLHSLIETGRTSSHFLDFLENNPSHDDILEFALDLQSERIHKVASGLTMSDGGAFDAAVVRLADACHDLVKFAPRDQVSALTAALSDLEPSVFEKLASAVDDVRDAMAVETA